MTENNTNEKIQELIDSNDVFLFMKGSPEAPQCGFSGQTIFVLNQYPTAFASFNVLEDYEVREGIKAFSNWPTIPQLYVKGKFVGGCDIITEMHRKGELEALFASL